MQSAKVVYCVFHRRACRVSFMQQSFKKGKKKRKDQAWLEKSLKSCVCGHGFHFIPRLLFEGRKENKTAGTDYSVHCRSAFKHLFFFLSFLLLSLSLYNHVLESSSTIVRLQSSRDKPCVFICMSSRCFSLQCAMNVFWNLCSVKVNFRFVSLVWPVRRKFSFWKPVFKQWAFSCIFNYLAR